MKFEFPDTGEGVTEGKFLDWKIEEGDRVEEDQVVGEAETDKAVVEIPAPSDGKVKKLLAEPGDNVEVGEIIMELETDEDVEEGDTINEGDVRVLRPGYTNEDGLHPRHLNTVIGKQAQETLSAGDPVKWKKIN